MITEIRFTPRFCIPLLIALTWLVYSEVATLDFVAIDDPMYVTNNPTVLSGLSVDNMMWAFSKTPAKHYNPLVWLSFMLDAQLFGRWAGGYHLTNLGLHISNSILLFLFWNRLSGAPGKSFVLALLFAIHPTHVESVAWVTERKDCLSTLFALLTFHCYFQSIRQPSWKWRVLAAVTYLACLLSKAMFVTLPLLLVLLDYWPLRRFQYQQLAPTAANDRRHRRAWAALLHTLIKNVRGMLVGKEELVVLSLMFALVAYFANGGPRDSQPLLELSFFDRVGNAVISYVAYLKMAFVPTGLAVFYPHPGKSISFAAILGAIALLAGITICCVRFRDRHPHLIVGWMWFAVGLLPVLGLVRLGDYQMADRYLYTPLIGILVMALWSADSLVKATKHVFSKPAGYSVAMSAIVVCMWLSKAQIGVWRNSETLFRHALAVTSDNPCVHNFLGAYLVKQSRLDEAIVELKKAVAVGSWNGVAHRNLGGALFRRGELDAAKTEFEVALSMAPKRQDIRALLVEVQLRRAKAEWEGNQTPRAAAILDAISADVAELPLDHIELSSVRNNVVAAYLEVGKWAANGGAMERAADYFRRAVLADPNHVQARYNLGLANARLGRLTEATIEFQEALQIDPQFGVAHLGLAQVFQVQGRIAEAKRHYDAVSELRTARDESAKNSAIR